MWYEFLAKLGSKLLPKSEVYSPLGLYLGVPMSPHGSFFNVIDLVVYQQQTVLLNKTYNSYDKLYHFLE